MDDIFLYKVGGPWRTVVDAYQMSVAYSMTVWLYHPWVVFQWVHSV